MNQENPKERKKNFFLFILSNDGAKFRENILILISIILLISMFVTLYNVEDYRQECVSHYEKQLNICNCFGPNNPFNNSFEFDWNIISGGKNGNQD